MPCRALPAPTRFESRVLLLTASAPCHPADTNANVLSMRMAILLARDGSPHQGDFFVHLLDVAGPDLTKRASQLSPARLT